MKTYAYYGLGAAFLGLLLNSALFFTGFHADPTKLSLAGWVAGLGGVAISVVMTLLGIREVREQKGPAVEFTYAMGFKAAMLVTLFAAVGGVISNYLYTQVINPGFNDLMMQAQVAAMREKGLPEDQITMSIDMAKKMQHPAIAGAFAFMGGLFFGLLLSLILAIFTRRKAALPEAPPQIS